MTEEAADLEVGADDAVRNIQVDRLIGLDPVEIRDLPLQIQVDRVDSLDPRLKVGYALRNIQVDRLIGLDPVEIRDVPL